MKSIKLTLAALAAVSCAVSLHGAAHRALAPRAMTIGECLTEAKRIKAEALAEVARTNAGSASAEAKQQMNNATNAQALQAIAQGPILNARLGGSSWEDIERALTGDVFKGAMVKSVVDKAKPLYEAVMAQLRALAAAQGQALPGEDLSESTPGAIDIWK